MQNQQQDTEHCAVERRRHIIIYYNNDGGTMCYWLQTTRMDRKCPRVLFQNTEQDVQQEIFQLTAVVVLKQATLVSTKPTQHVTVKQAVIRLQSLSATV